jgi:hypothetical protein
MLDWIKGRGGPFLRLPSEVPHQAATRKLLVVRSETQAFTTKPERKLARGNQTCEANVNAEPFRQSASASANVAANIAVPDRSERTMSQPFR